MNNRLFGILAIAGLACFTCARGSAASVDGARQTTNLAASIVEDAHEARAALVAGHDDAAGTDIERALETRAELARLAQSEGLRTIVPVYSELDDTTLLSQAATKDNAAKAAPTALVVRKNTAAVTYLAMDVEKTKARLDAAKEALDNHNVQAAKDSLAAVDSDFIVGSNAVDVPLLTAREDLALAGRAMKMKDDTEAQTDLQQAAKSLRAYTDANHSADARRLADTISSATPLDANANSSVVSKIDSWWSSVEGWFAQHA